MYAAVKWLAIFKSQATFIPTFSLKERRGKFPRPYWGEALARRLCGILPRYGRASGVRGDVKQLLKSREWLAIFKITKRLPHSHSMVPGGLLVIS